MKSIEQMQMDVLRKARWDGGYPRAVYIFPSGVKLAHTPEEFERDKRFSRRCAAFFGLSIVGIAFWMIGFVIRETVFR
jgi:hypothetical protein